MGATSQGIGIEERKPLKPERHKAAPLIFCPETPKPARRLTRSLRLRSLNAPFAKPSLSHSAKEKAQPLRLRYGFANCGNVSCHLPADPPKQG